MNWRLWNLQECVSNETCLPVGLFGPFDGASGDG